MPSTEWETPQDFFDVLDAEFGFTVDVCASYANAKCQQYWTKYDSAMDRPWVSGVGEICWMNPPYDRNIWRWLHKAWMEAQHGATVVALIQGRSTDTKMWHDWVMRASEIRFIRDRLHFKLNGESARGNHSSVVVVFRPFCQGPPIVSSIDTKGNKIMPFIPDSVASPQSPSAY